jgi:SlyX protein
MLLLTQTGAAASIPLPHPSPELIMTDIAAQLEALETRIAFQDQTIEELNATITAQWRQIDLLTRRLDTMEEQVRSGVQIADPSTEPPPPHY